MQDGKKQEGNSKCPKATGTDNWSSVGSLGEVRLGRTGGQLWTDAHSLVEGIVSECASLIIN